MTQRNKANNAINKWKKTNKTITKTKRKKGQTIQ
jgi:hypothetical protein